MITKETLEAVRIGILTDEQLDEALSHYKTLEEYLKFHIGTEYHLVWKDVYMTLMVLENYKESRARSKKENT
jgi:hypothetical protein